uniref:Uncharacterized protein n=1 Tax=Entomoneis paludosa TaxID=265537 RepID=A0A7S3DW49_9STRA|mmetsp:Transcript_5460/g.11597  ORF Transcript_5460/g.11597 Transcript_5460/m.11597 type:complete len:114 (+) Transcript_5460:762-1103(+)
MIVRLPQQHRLSLHVEKEEKTKEGISSFSSFSNNESMEEVRVMPCYALSRFRMRWLMEKCARELALQTFASHRSTKMAVGNAAAAVRLRHPFTIVASFCCNRQVASFCCNPHE